MNGLSKAGTLAYFVHCYFLTTYNSARPIVGAQQIRVTYVNECLTPALTRD